MIKTFRMVFGLMVLSAFCSNPPWLLIPGNQPAYAQPASEPPAKSQITYKGGPGDTPETAVVILGAPNAMAGIAAEYSYLKKKFGRENEAWHADAPERPAEKGKVYDRMDLDLKDGSKKTVFFDISEFFGKL